jgi:hypothetical protein
VKKENIAKEIAEKEDEEDEKKTRRGRTKGWIQPFQKKDISVQKQKGSAKKQKMNDVEDLAHELFLLQLEQVTQNFLNIIKTLNSILFSDDEE